MSGMKKVLNIIQRYYPAEGGAERFFWTLSEYLANDLALDVDVWTTDALNSETLWDLDGSKVEQKEEIVRGVNVKRFPIGKGIFKYKYPNKTLRVLFDSFPNFKLANLATCPTAFKMLDEIGNIKQYDCVTVSSSPYYFIFYVGYLISKKLNIPYIIAPAFHSGVDSSDPLRKKYYKKTAVPFFEHASKIILNTKQEGEAIYDFCKDNGVEIDKEKFMVLGQGVYLDKIMGGNGKRFREKYNLKYPIVFQMGAKTVEKGSFDLVESMKRVWDSGKNVHLVFAGLNSKDFDFYLKNLDEEYRKNILNIDNISEEEKWDLFDAGDIFSMISKTDSFGIVYLEAWTYSKPVLACKNEVMEEIFDDGKDGYLLEYGDTEKIAEKIVELLEDESKRKEVGSMGRRKVEEKYDWKKVMKKVDEIYNKL